MYSLFSLPLFIGILFILPVHSQDVRLDSIVRQDFVGNRKTPTQKTIFSYDENDRVNNEEKQRWDPVSEAWLSETRTTTSYETQKPDTIIQWRFENALWIPVSRSISNESISGSKQTLSQNWDSVQNIWINASLISKYSFDETSARTSSLWDKNLQDWQRTDSTIIHLDVHRLPTMDTTFYFVPLVNIASVGQVTEYLYSDQNDLLERIRWSTDTAGHALQRSSRDTFGYDNMGFQTLSQFDIWNVEKENWELSLKIERTPNVQGYLSESRIFIQDDYVGMVIPTSRLTYKYLADSLGIENDSLVSSVMNFIYQGGIEIPDYRKTYYYSDLSHTSTDYKAFDQLVVYPNPAERILEVEGEWPPGCRYIWYDASGKWLRGGILTHKLIPVPFQHGEPRTLILQIWSGDYKRLQTWQIMAK